MRCGTSGGAGSFPDSMPLVSQLGDDRSAISKSGDVSGSILSSVGPEVVKDGREYRSIGASISLCGRYWFGNRSDVYGAD